jgi:ABC-type siderophore export system fused ATPase/permease subunit
MPKTYEHPQALPQLFRQLADDGARVAETELALARAEAAAMVRGYVTAIAVALLCLVFAIATLIVMAQAGIIALIPYVSNPAYAYLSVGLFLTAVAIVLALISGNLLSRRHYPVGLIFKWLMGEGPVK